jgi:hypothetical protein
MAVLLDNITNCVWQAFDVLQQDKSGYVHKSKLKVSRFEVLKWHVRFDRIWKRRCSSMSRLEALNLRRSRYHLR